MQQQYYNIHHHDKKNNNEYDDDDDDDKKKKNFGSTHSCADFADGTLSEIRGTAGSGCTYEY